MATDSSEPRVGVIAKTAVLAVVILAGTRLALATYFDSIASAEEMRKYGQIAPTALLNLRADEDRRLKSGPMPIDKAMKEMASRGRMVASPDIVPSASRDLGPMQGWMKMPNDVPVPMTAAPESADASAPAATGPSAATADGGARAADGGAPKKAEKKLQP